VWLFAWLGTYAAMPGAAPVLSLSISLLSQGIDIFDHEHSKIVMTSHL
jgi:hypothetical protein